MKFPDKLVLSRLDTIANIGFVDQVHDMRIGVHARCPEQHIDGELPTVEIEIMSFLENLNEGEPKLPTQASIKMSLQDLFRFNKQMTKLCKAMNHIYQENWRTGGEDDLPFD